MAGAQGLKWQGLGTSEEQASLAWNEACGFFTVAYPKLYPYSDEKGPQTNLYILEGNQNPPARLTWFLSADASPEERAAHEQLAGLIAAHTHLPLRDLSPAFAALARVTAPRTTPPLQLPVDATPAARDESWGVILPAIEPHENDSVLQLRAWAFAYTAVAVLILGMGLVFRHLHS